MPHRLPQLAVTLGLLASTSLSFAAGTSQWRAGIAAVGITPPYQVTLGGYADRRAPIKEWFRHKDARLFKPNAGIHDPIRIKVMHLESGEGAQARQVLWIGMDVVAAPAELRDALAEKLAPLGYEKSSILVSGTHTHSGPGALTRNPVWELGAMDLFHKKFHSWWIERAVEAVRLARARLEPVELFAGRFDAEGIQHNRRSGDHVVDRTVHSLFARTPDGRWLGGLVNLAVHGISLSEDNLLLSADTPGALERASESVLATRTREIGIAATDGAAPTVIFINGAEGDVSPDGFGFEGIALMGERFGRQLEASWADLALLGDGLELREFDVSLGRPKVTLKNCSNSSWLKYFKLGVGRWFPRSAALTQLRIGGRNGVSLLSWPGEPTSELGLELRAAAEAAGARDAWIMGLTNGHLGYFTSEWDYELGGLETCLNFYGKSGGRAVVDAHLKEIKQ